MNGRHRSLIWGIVCVFGITVMGVYPAARLLKVPFFMGLQIWALSWGIVASFFALAGLILHQLRRTGLGLRKHQEHQARHLKPYESIFRALDQLSQGNFDIFVDAGGQQVYQELAQRINVLARELGSMEQMRQDFVSNVSHEIRSPLTSIAGFAALLKEKELPEELRRHYLEVIEKESGRLVGLSDNLLRLSMLDSEQVSLNKASFELDRQIREVLLLLEPQWEQKGLDIEVELDKTVYTGDQELLEQVWINLIHNAIKYTPTEGRIAVKLQCRENEISCAVTDSGMGIAQDDQMHIFERFYKVDKSRDRSQGGNGLGLALVKEIVGRHGGSIRVESEVGNGSIFLVRLPSV